MIFVESSRDACLSFDECYEICFRQNCTFSFALFVHFHLTFTVTVFDKYGVPYRYVDEDLKAEVQMRYLIELLKCKVIKNDNNTK